MDIYDDDPVEASAASSTSRLALSLSTRVEYSVLPRGSRQELFGLVTVTAAEAPEPPREQGDDGEPSAGEDTDGEREPMDVVCVLDVSDSRSGRTIQVLQEVVGCVVEQVREKDRLSLVAFSDKATGLLSLRRMAEDGKRAAIVASQRLVRGGGSNIVAGFDLGVSIMEKRRSRNKVSAMLLLTDGGNRGRRERIPELAKRCRTANCTLHTFGFGKDHDSGMLADIAKHAMTPPIFVKDARHLREALASVVGSLSSVAARNIEVYLSCRGALKAVHTAFAVQKTSGNQAIVSIPDIFVGQRRDILVQLGLPIDAEELEFLEQLYRRQDGNLERLADLTGLDLAAMRQRPCCCAHDWAMEVLQGTLGVQEAAAAPEPAPASPRAGGSAHADTGEVIVEPTSPGSPTSAVSSLAGLTRSITGAIGSIFANTHEELRQKGESNEAESTPLRSSAEQLGHCCTPHTPPSGTLLLEATAEYLDLRRGATLQTPAATMSTVMLDHAAPELEPDEEVSTQRERWEAARAPCAGLQR